MRDEPRRPRSGLVSCSTEQDRSPQMRDRRQGMYPSTPASSLRNTKNEDLTTMFLQIRFLCLLPSAVCRTTRV